ncbi:MAG: hypothetical protein HKN21_13170, partial [Candidatus Eisenbacteria bacterium]|nr:hypothetical protein [Candidatus Eisenbacteria bacterium]
VQYVVPFGEKPGKALEDFLAQPVVTAPPVLGFQRKVDAGKPRFGDVASMDVAKLAKSEDHWDHFHAGVAYRARYDSPDRESEDFAKAVHHWTRALEIDPNNYIFRRRLQQYGPRLDKPYPFYDWVAEAREEIAARGEEPLALVTEPGLAEYAEPQKQFQAAENSEVKEPDPQGKLDRDESFFVQAKVVTIPEKLVPGQAARVHVTLEPKGTAHWNNEVEASLLWIEAPEGWEANRTHVAVALPKKAHTNEPRHFEFEVYCPESAEPGTVSFSPYAAYYICEDDSGVCLYRRQDIEVNLLVAEGELE